MQFIEVTRKDTQKRISINVATIERICEDKDGTAFIATEVRGRKYSYGLSVMESYENVCRMIADKIF